MNDWSKSVEVEYATGEAEVEEKEEEDDFTNADINNYGE